MLGKEEWGREMKIENGLLHSSGVRNRSDQDENIYTLLGGHIYCLIL